MDRVKKRRPVGLTGKVSAPSSRESRTMTPFRTNNLTSYSLKSCQSNCRSTKGSVKMPHKRRLEAKKFYSKGMVTPSTKDPSQDSTSIVMPSGVSSFLLDCMDLDSEDTLPSIETFRKADTYDEGTGLVSEDEILHVKNSTLLDLSHAVDIAMQQPPNLSSILELSPVTDFQAAKETFCLSPPLPVSPLSSSLLVKQKNTSMSMSTAGTTICSFCFLMLIILPFNTEFVLYAGIDIETSGDDEKTPKTRRVILPSPVVKKKPFTGRDKPIKCRKVTFNDIVSTRDITTLNPEVESPVVLLKPSLEPAKFFDFADERERAAFFQRLKKTHTFHFPAKPIIFH
ncbi:hypothetical protein AMEX_G20726 [Astyanax mexicanus]|uniref:Uncharacterized protein n=1 Tax=Astyanax mexicanus TaxID=7994 RepID=A0A8T2L868_ASTMX|nr:hypothetical protein AMEX_G20726 [Astyanax mexicanus]